MFVRLIAPIYVLSNQNDTATNVRREFIHSAPMKTFMQLDECECGALVMTRVENGKTFWARHETRQGVRCARVPLSVQLGCLVTGCELCFPADLFALKCGHGSVCGEHARNATCPTCCGAFCPLCLSRHECKQGISKAAVAMFLDKSIAAIRMSRICTTARVCRCAIRDESCDGELRTCDACGVIKACSIHSIAVFNVLPDFAKQRTCLNCRMKRHRFACSVVGCNGVLIGETHLTHVMIHMFQHLHL